MKILRLQLFFMVSLSATLFITAQTQIGNDINGNVASDEYGRQVSLSSDGNIVAVACSANASEGVKVYSNNEGSWELYGTDAEGNHFDDVPRSSVSLAPDGTALAIGGSGITRVYNYMSGTWIQKGADIPNSSGDDSFGQIVSLSSDANTIAISTPDYDISALRGSVPPPPKDGLVQIFRYESGNWNQIGSDIVGGDNELVGTNISLSSDGTTIAISKLNSVDVYENIDDAWSLKGSVVSDYNITIYEGLSISQDGNIIALGNPGFTDDLTANGQVTVYEFQSDEWLQIGTEILGQEAYSKTGYSVSLSSDGQVLAIGETGTENGATFGGKARIFENQNGTWVQIGEDIVNEILDGHFGWSVSLSADANAIAIGAPFYDNGTSNTGKARVYDLSAALSIDDVAQSTITLFPNPSREQFTIQLPEGVDLISVTLYNSLGKLIYTSTSNTVDTSKLASGVYYVDVTTSRGKSTKKVLVD